MIKQKKKYWKSQVYVSRLKTAANRNKKWKYEKAINLMKASRFQIYNEGYVYFVTMAQIDRMPRALKQ